MRTFKVLSVALLLLATALADAGAQTLPVRTPHGGSRPSLSSNQVHVLQVARRRRPHRRPQRRRSGMGFTPYNYNGLVPNLMPNLSPLGNRLN